MDMTETLGNLGTNRVDTTGTISDGLKMVEKGAFDFAILDINLRGDVSFDIADALTKRDIPFVFVTGYGSAIDVPDRLKTTPVLPKPVDEGILSSTLERILK